ncbi:MAG TPA: hypothetical protein VMB79_06765, partial [Jatrophihabitans sp.]|nr:hypothetical protein [Jatrophihabitans sp.]
TLLGPVRAALAGRLTWRDSPALSVSALGARAGQLGAGILAWQAIGRPAFDAWPAGRLATGR